MIATTATGVVTASTGTGAGSRTTTGTGVTVATLPLMPKSAKPEPTTRTASNGSSRYNPDNPRLRLDKEADEDDQEGDTTLTFITHPGSSQPPSSRS